MLHLPSAAGTARIHSAQNQQWSAADPPTALLDAMPMPRSSQKRGDSSPQYNRRPAQQNIGGRVADGDRVAVGRGGDGTITLAGMTLHPCRDTLGVKLCGRSIPTCGLAPELGFLLDQHGAHIALREPLAAHKTLLLVVLRTLRVHSRLASAGVLVAIMGGVLRTAAFTKRAAIARVASPISLSESKAHWSSLFCRAASFRRMFAFIAV